MAVGTGLIVIPFVAGLSIAAVVTGMAIGAIAVSLGLAGTAPSGRGTLPVSAQAAYDRGLALGLFLVGILFGVYGDAPAVAVFGVAGLLTLGVTLTTRYRPHPA